MVASSGAIPGRSTAAMAHVCQIILRYPLLRRRGLGEGVTSTVTALPAVADAATTVRTHAAHRHSGRVWRGLGEGGFVPPMLTTFACGITYVGLKTSQTERCQQ